MDKFAMWLGYGFMAVAGFLAFWLCVWGVIEFFWKHFPGFKNVFVDATGFYKKYKHDPRLKQ